MDKVKDRDLRRGSKVSESESCKISLDVEMENVPNARVGDLE